MTETTGRKERNYPGKGKTAPRVLVYVLSVLVVVLFIAAVAGRGTSAGEVAAPDPKTVAGVEAEKADGYSVAEHEAAVAEAVEHERGLADDRVATCQSDIAILNDSRTMLASAASVAFDEAVKAANEGYGAASADVFTDALTQLEASNALMDTLKGCN